MTAAQRARLAREEASGGSLAERAVSLLGLLVFIGLGWLMSVHRGAVNWRTVAWGFALQFVFAALILLTAPGRAVFQWLNGVFTSLLGFTTEGARFLFGNLVMSNVPVGTAEGPMAPVGAPPAGRTPARTSPSASCRPSSSSPA